MVQNPSIGHLLPLWGTNLIYVKILIENPGFGLNQCWVLAHVSFYISKWLIRGCTRKYVQVFSNVALSLIFVNPDRGESHKTFQSLYLERHGPMVVRSRQTTNLLTGQSRQITNYLTGLSRQRSNYLTGPMVKRSRQITNYLTGQSRQRSNYLTGQSRQRSNYLTGLSRQIAFPILYMSLPN